MSELDEVMDAVVVEDSTTALVVQHGPASLFRTDDPVEVIEKATAVANALKGVVVSRGLIKNIKGRDHPLVEAWQTLGSMLGVFPVKEWVRAIPWPNPIPDSLKAQHAKGLAFGYEASFVAQRADGAVVGGGEAACERTESTWKDRDDYALRSMAQTRATSKCLKAPLGFVMVLAGYESTPAEEMPPGEKAQASVFGERASADLEVSAKQACTMLTGGDVDLAVKLYQHVVADCGLYLPRSAALALIRAASAADPSAVAEAPIS